MPGFRTAEQVSGISGRGVGMDVVRSEVLALGGRIETSTEPGQGSVFELVLPLTTAMTQVVMLRMGDFVVGVPASLVEVVRRLPLPELEAAYQSGTLVQADGSQLPFLWAGAVWSQSPRSTDSTGGETRPVIIINSASQRLALHVDEVLGSQEVVVKNLGVQLARLPGLAGMSLLPSGAVVLIYNPVALVAVHGEKIRALGQGLPAILDDAQAKLLRQQSAAAGRASRSPRGASAPHHGGGRFDHRAPRHPAFAAARGLSRQHRGRWFAGAGKTAGRAARCRPLGHRNAAHGRL